MTVRGGPCVRHRHRRSSRFSPQAPLMTSSRAGRSGTDPRAKALVEEYLDEKRREAPSDASSSRIVRGRAYLLGAVAAICAAAWLVPYPTSADDAASTPVVQAASARITVFLAASKVRDFRTRHTRLPATLAEAGITDASLEYAAGRDTLFTVRTLAAGEQIVYDSRQPPHSVLRGAVAIVEGRGR